NPRIDRAKTFSEAIVSQLPEDQKDAILENKEGEFTIFLSVNDSNIRDFNERYRSKEKIKTLRRHIVRGRHNYESIKEKGKLTTLDGDILKFYFSPDPNYPGEELVKLECRGHNTTVELFDIDKTNGIFHMIQHVLGYYTGTIYQRMRDDEFRQYRYIFSFF
uniref:FAS1 domain-containing protein n=1 Tax=Glossina brevipalpis TaxID=37001 RepID=A0A1A9WIU5_9MUSC